MTFYAIIHGIFLLMSAIIFLAGILIVADAFTSEPDEHENTDDARG